MKSGGLLLFNGKNSMHRVTKVNCDEIRILAVLAYNDKPGSIAIKVCANDFLR